VAIAAEATAAIHTPVIVTAVEAMEATVTATVTGVQVILVIVTAVTDIHLIMFV
jgi:hypothetical protein